jgi:hypothetical protein
LGNVIIYYLTLSFEYNDHIINIACRSPLLVHELWGKKYWGSNFAAMGLAPAAGSYLLSTLMAGRLYEQHIKGSGTQCYGRECYSITFFITAAICAFGTVVGFILLLRTRSIYRKKNNPKRALND